MSAPSCRGPLRLRDRLREEADRTILAAAEEVFAEVGLGARMERIAEQAGVAVGTLYNHFEDRNALLDALSCSRRGMLFERLDAALAEGEGKPIREQLRALLKAVGEHGKLHGRFLSVLVQAGEGPARWKPRASVVDGLLARAKVLLERGIASGELRPEGQAVYGLALVAMIRVAIFHVLQGEASWEALSEPIIELFLRGAQR